MMKLVLGDYNRCFIDYTTLCGKFTYNAGIQGDLQTFL